MCLHATTRTPFRAEKDITCYKVFEIKTDEVLVSPYQKKRFQLGKLYTDTVKAAVFPTSPYRSDIDGGFFHSFMDMEGAKEEMDQLHGCRDYVNGKIQLAIYECLIPKGAKMFKGRYFRALSYASRKIKVLKRCEL